ncbi:MAG: FAD:protein FMN transferase [Armatimonadota bacterium]|nr:MAG: FAD:protein FMN transferase [Armatimonadota bacterium]
MRREQFIGGGVILAVAALVGVGLWQISHPRAARWVAVGRYPQGVMGTDCTLAAVVQEGEEGRAEQALDEAEAVLRGVESRMSTWLSDSEISRLNAAGAGEEVPLSPETLAVLRAAREAAGESEGAFDVTVRPLINLWRGAGERDRLPTEAEVAEARAASSWEMIELTEKGAIKRRAEASVDLGGVAKGYAIDRAIETLQRAGGGGGLVDVGGDLRCFGRPLEGEEWPVEVKDPFAEGNLGELRVRNAAVCTSGNYARFTVIGGKPYSHIIDSRSGRPAAAVPSVTVIAPEALTADVWATALSVLGVQGLERLPPEADAVMVLGDKEDYGITCTPRVAKLVGGPLRERLTVWQAD